MLGFFMEGIWLLMCILPDVQGLMFCFRLFPQRFTKVVGATYGSASQQLANDLKCVFSAFSGHDAATWKSKTVSPPEVLFSECCP